MKRFATLCLVALSLVAAAPHESDVGAAPAGERHYLYVAEPGIRNYVEYGGVGLLVYDMDRGYTFVRRIATQDVPAGAEPENVKGVAASAHRAAVRGDPPPRHGVRSHDRPETLGSRTTAAAIGSRCRLTAGS